MAKIDFEDETSKLVLRNFNLVADKKNLPLLQQAEVLLNETPLSRGTIQTRCCSLAKLFEPKIEGFQLRSIIYTLSTRHAKNNW